MRSFIGRENFASLHSPSFYHIQRDHTSQESTKFDEYTKIPLFQTPRKNYHFFCERTTEIVLEKFMGIFQGNISLEIGKVIPLYLY